MITLIGSLTALLNAVVLTTIAPVCLVLDLTILLLEVLHVQPPWSRWAAYSVATAFGFIFAFRTVTTFISALACAEFHAGTSSPVTISALVYLQTSYDFWFACLSQASPASREVAALVRATLSLALACLYVIRESVEILRGILVILSLICWPFWLCFICVCIARLSGQVGL